MHAHSATDRQITVGVDGSPASLAALRWAHEQAALRSAKLMLLTVWPVPATRGIDGIGSEADAHAVAAAAIQSVLGRDGGSVQVWVTSYPAEPAEALLRRATKSQLIVVGRHRAHTVAEHLLGSVTERLLSEAACPVAVIHAVPERTSQRIVVGIDGSAAADAALRWALEQARVSDSKIEAILVWDWRPEYGVHPYGASQEAQEGRARVTLERTVGALPSQARAVLTCHLVRGHPTGVLLAAAEDADLLVVGNNRGGAPAERVLGSVSRRLALASTQPVVVTHAAASAERG